MRILIKKSQFKPIERTDKGYVIEFDPLAAIPEVEGREEQITCVKAILPLSANSDGVKAVIASGIKKRFSNEILAGFRYDDNHFVTLSEYDQTNFSRLYAMAGLPSLYPLTINIGRSEDQHTITLADKTAFDAFITAVNTFIEGKRAECRRVLAEINWEDYEI